MSLKFVMVRMKSILVVEILVNKAKNGGSLTMINFSSNPLQSDIATLMNLSQKDDQLLKALDKSDVARINDILEKSNLVPKMVLVHGKDGTYWATRMVNPGDSNPKFPKVTSIPEDVSAVLKTGKWIKTSQNL